MTQKVTAQDIIEALKQNEFSVEEIVEIVDTLKEECKHDLDDAQIGIVDLEESYVDFRDFR